MAARLESTKKAESTFAVLESERERRTRLKEVGRPGDDAKKASHENEVLLSMLSFMF